MAWCPLFPQYFCTVTFPLIVVTVIFISLSYILLRWRFPPHRLPYPPGPPERNLISGNMSDMPEDWRTFVEWGKTYGAILHFRIYNKHTIILNSQEDNVELLEKPSNMYSDRPSRPMMDLLQWPSFNTAFMKYGPKWRYHRRLFQQYFKPDISLNYRPIQTSKVHDFLHGLLVTPEDFANHYVTLSAAVIMSALYDYDVAPKDDFFVGLANAANKCISEAFFPGGSLLNVLPILRFTPSWFPGARFKRFGLEGRKLTFQMRDLPIAAVEEKMKAGKAPNCMTAELLEGCKSKQEHDDITGVATSAYAAGADTTASTLGTFFYAMATYPDVQARAKQDIDLIIGSERLVNFGDRASLPYIGALCREILRWKPVLPLGIAHAALADDVYKGYYIPKGAIVIYNVGAMTHDPVKYPEPDLFNPSRFLRENGELADDEVLVAFGFGRRICPGRHLASATLWLAVATVLQNFDITLKRDSKGKEIPISGEYTSGMLSHPLPFECSITPRSAAARKNILE